MKTLTHMAGAGMVILSVLTATPDARACSCKPHEDPIEAARQSTAVFLGELLRYDEDEHGIAMHFSVVDRVKGPSEPELVVRSSASTCFLPIRKVRGQFLIYAVGAPNSLETSICTRTISVTNPKTELELLKASIAQLDGPHN